MTNLYLERADDSDVSGYYVAATSDSAGPIEPMRHKTARSVTHPRLLGSFLSPGGFPGVAGTYAKSVAITLKALTDVLTTIFTLRFDLLRYKTTGTVASVTASFNFDKSEGPGGKLDKITRATGNFVTDGFTAGCRITIVDSLACDGSYIVESLTPGVLQLSHDTPLPITPFLTPGAEAEYTLDSCTISTKEQLLVAGTPCPGFSDGGAITMPTISFSQTFASDDRLVVRAWAQKMAGNTDAWIGVGTEGATPCVVALT